MPAPSRARARLDVVLVERGHFPSRARAQAAVLAGRVQIDGRPAPKPGLDVSPQQQITVAPAKEFASRGGTKLANALDALGLDPAGARALDLGASTGGFTDCLLQRGAEHVVALDVGYGQLDWRLRTDPRVTVMERTNARDLVPERLPYAPDLVTCDLSFIGVGVVWPAVAACLDPAHRALVMVKPQFEVGRERIGAHGVVHDDAARADAVLGVAAALESAGGRICGVAASGLPGPRGNREVFLMALGPAAAGEALSDLDAAVALACAA